MTTWDFTPTCRGFDYFYGFYGPAQDYYTHESGGAFNLTTARPNFNLTAHPKFLVFALTRSEWFAALARRT